MAISTTPDNEIKKNAMIEELQRDVMSCFNEKAKSNKMAKFYKRENLCNFPNFNFYSLHGMQISRN